MQIQRMKGTQRNEKYYLQQAIETQGHKTEDDKIKHYIYSIVDLIG